MAAISQPTFSNAFSSMKMLKNVFKFHLDLFLGVLFTISHHWFRKWLGADYATSHYRNQWWLSSLTHICVTRPQWVNNYFADWRSFIYVVGWIISVKCVILLCFVLLRLCYKSLRLHAIHLSVLFRITTSSIIRLPHCREATLTDMDKHDQ